MVYHICRLCTAHNNNQIFSWWYAFVRRTQIVYEETDGGKSKHHHKRLLQCTIGLGLPILVACGFKTKRYDTNTTQHIRHHKKSLKPLYITIYYKPYFLYASFQCIIVAVDAVSSAAFISGI